MEEFANRWTPADEAMMRRRWSLVFRGADDSLLRAQLDNPWKGNGTLRSEKIAAIMQECAAEVWNNRYRRYGGGAK